MYIPTLFRENDVATLQTFMQQHSFATVITYNNSQCIVSHLPLLIDTHRGEYGTLSGHMARENQQWQSFTDTQEALVMFQGPHAYISPSWYSVAESVPTWNYADVYAYGFAKIIDDPDRIHTMLTDLVAYHENQFTIPWVMDLPQDYLQKMLRNIVSFEIEITRCEGKFKLSQNRSIGDQESVITQLTTSIHPINVQTGNLMRQHLADTAK